MSSNVEFKIRLSTLEDIPELERLIVASVRTLHSGIYSSAQIEGALGKVFGIDSQLIRDGTYFAVEWNNTLVGCGGWSRRKTLFGADAGKIEADPLLDPKQDAARIRAFFVHPDWSRRGIGTLIMKASEQAAMAAGFKRIEIVATLVGVPLYTKFGYAVVKKSEIQIASADPMSVVYLARNIGTQEKE